MTTRKTLASAIIAGALVLGVTGCANTEAPSTASASVATTASAAATPEASPAAAPLTMPAVAPFDMRGVEIDPAVVELYGADAAGAIGPVMEKFLATAHGFTELQKGSRVNTVEDWKLIEPELKPLVTQGMWDWTVGQYEKREMLRFAPQLGFWEGTDEKGFGLDEGAPGYPADTKYLADDRGYDWSYNNDDIKVSLNTFDNGTYSVTVGGIKERILIRTTDAKMVQWDGLWSYTLWFELDGGWRVNSWESKPMGNAHVLTTQEELDALHAI